MTPGVAWGEKKTDLPTRSKWQIGLLLWLKALFGGVRQRRRGDNVPPSGVQGCPPGESLVTFFSKRKSPGVGGAERPLMGRSAEDGAPAPPREKPPLPAGPRGYTAFSPQGAPSEES